MRSKLRRSLYVVCVAAPLFCGCRPEADVPPGEDIREVPSANEPLGGQTRSPAAEEVPTPTEAPPAEPAEPATPLRPAPGGSEE